MIFVDRQVLRLAYSWRVEANTMRIFGLMPARRLQNRQLRGRIDVEIGERVVHRIEVAGLAGESQVILPADQLLIA